LTTFRPTGNCSATDNDDGGDDEDDVSGESATDNDDGEDVSGDGDNDIDDVAIGNCSTFQNPWFSLSSSWIYSPPTSYPSRLFQVANRG
jgi:hypothetical protein